MTNLSPSWLRSRTALALIAITVILGLTASAFGQVASGSIQGTVKDSSGALVAGATVTVVNVDTQFTRTAATDNNGLFAFVALPLGQYKLTVQAKGFANYSENIQVTVGSRLEREISLNVGTTATTVEVLGGGAISVNTINQEVSSVVSANEVSQLPTLTRNPYDLVATASNAQQDSQAGVGDARGAGYSINGQRSASTSILLDGAENVDLFTAAVGQTVPQDSVQEFRVISNGLTAEYGRASGGVVNVATKSGTNNFHGSAYEYNRVAA
ncbi:MAG TPA: carboxypeptidase regulatory-like domain-containing protein, partial [Terriglobales bacterium]|nr:carboxypeptidase regulatory-like domain-containing protein [Terriglobales bacterium]